MGILYVVATPIGNLEDVTLRALRVLGEVGLIAAEDTRTTRKLLSKYGIHTRLVSYHQFSGEGRVRQLLALLEEQDVALVTDAGTPTLSDPGVPLIREAVAHGFSVQPVPGPSALAAALSASGLPADQAVFLGFLPRKLAERRRTLAALAEDTRTAVAYEAPHRVRKSLADIRDALGDRPLAVCRELTKLYEEVFRGSAETALEHFVSPRGEFVVVIGGAGLTADYWQGSAPTEAVERELRGRRGSRSAPPRGRSKRR